MNETNQGRFILCDDGRSQLYNNDTGKIISDDDSSYAALSDAETQGGGESKKYHAKMITKGSRVQIIFRMPMSP